MIKAGIGRGQKKGEIMRQELSIRELSIKELSINNFLRQLRDQNLSFQIFKSPQQAVRLDY